MKKIKTLFVTLAVIAVISSGSFAIADSGALSASFMADVNTGAAPLTIHFEDRSAGSPTEWHWDFGDGSYSTLQSPTYTYNTPGTYTVTLTVNDGAHSDTMSGDVVVTNPLVTTPTPRPDYGRIILVPIKDPRHVRPPHDTPATPTPKPPHKEQPTPKNPTKQPSPKAPDRHPAPKAPAKQPTERPGHK